MKGLTANTTIGNLRLSVIFLTESVTTKGMVGIFALEALRSRIGILLVSIMFSEDGITGFPSISACKDT